MDMQAMEYMLEEARLNRDSGSTCGAIRFYREFFKVARFSLGLAGKIQGNDGDKKYILSLMNEAKLEVRELAKEKSCSC